MKSENIAILRSVNQHITDPKFKKAKDIAEWMGAIQAQDYNMSKWALGIRLQDSTEDMINKEIDSGEIIRTHLLRPTWHFAAALDIHWLAELSAPQIKTALKYRDNQLELTEKIFSKSNAVIEKALSDHSHRTREELISELVKSGIEVDKNRASHILVRAEIEGIICGGRQKEGKPTYTILEEWVTAGKKKFYRDEALKELCRRYFTSRGPATIKDFNWWSGLSSGDSRLALELNRSHLISETFNNQTYWFCDSTVKLLSNQNNIYLLPAYDEFIIGYNDRTASISQTDHQKAVSNNGIFYPTILMGGKIIGIWKRNFENDEVKFSMRLFENSISNMDEVLYKSLRKYSEFLNRKIDLKINNL